MNDQPAVFPKSSIFALVGLSVAALAAQVLMVRVFSYTMNHGFV